MKKLLLCATLLLAAFLSASGANAAEKPNLNTATLEELAADPSIGREMAQKIVDLRSNIGDLTEWDDLKSIEGMSDAILDKIKEKFGIAGVESADCGC